MQIALDHGLDYRELAAWNNIENINVIRVGPGAAPDGARRRSRRRRPRPRVQTAPLRDRAAGGRRRAPAQRRTAPAPRRRRHARNTDDLQVAAEGGQGAVLRAGVARRAARCASVAATAAGAGSRSRRSSSHAPIPSPRRSRRRSSRASIPNPRRNPTATTRSTGCGRRRARSSTGFSEAANLKGIDIAGTSGQPVVASAGGNVVYAGTGLRGYGKLIIIKHNKTYLSAYAHNSDILVKEGQQVDARPEDRGDGQHRRGPGQAALRDPPAGQAGGSRCATCRPRERRRMSALRTRRRCRRIDARARAARVRARGGRPHHAAEPVADDEPSTARPEPDRWTQELPLPEPAAGLGADIVNDVTQLYLNEVGQHALLTRAGGARARAGDGAPATSRRGRR